MLITLLNVKILAILLAKELALFFERPYMEAQSFAIPSRIIQDNLQFIRYTFDWTGRKPGIGGSLVNLDHIKTFDSFDHQYFEAIPEVNC